LNPGWDSERAQHRSGRAGACARRRGAWIIRLWNAFPQDNTIAGHLQLGNRGILP
jgi:hypothetical protein